MQSAVTIDGIKWYIYGTTVRYAQPLCPKHHIRMYEQRSFSSQQLSDVRKLRCGDCAEAYEIPRAYASQKRYVIDKLDSKNFKKMKFINLDDETLIISEDKTKINDDKYFVKAILTESKVGKRLVVYAGEKGKKSKKDRTQIFVEPDIKRLAFDQTDMHPSDVFVKLEATFDDGTKHAIKKPRDEK